MHSVRHMRYHTITNISKCHLFLGEGLPSRARLSIIGGAKKQIEINVSKKPLDKKISDFRRRGP